MRQLQVVTEVAWLFVSERQAQLVWLCYRGTVMTYLVVKAAISGLVVML